MQRFRKSMSHSEESLILAKCFQKVSDADICYINCLLLSFFSGQVDKARPRVIQVSHTSNFPFVPVCYIIVPKRLSCEEITVRDIRLHSTV